MASKAQDYAKDFAKSGLHVLVPGTEPVADVIAVHGLAAHPWYTWTKKAQNNSQVNQERKVMWLQELLPSVIPRARILMYSYDSKYLVDAPKASLRSIATGLITELHAMRASEVETRHQPIIFLGHSFGGIVVEEALLYANQRENYRYLVSCTCGIVFLGTPHRGSSAASWGKVIARCAGLTGVKSDTRLLKTLEKGSERLELLVDDFVAMVREMGIDLVCFYELLETKKFPGFRKTVVEKISATIDGYDCLPLSLDHSGLNKFCSIEEEGFKGISSKLRMLVGKCHDFLASSYAQSYDRLLRPKALGHTESTVRNETGGFRARVTKQPSTSQVADIEPGVKLPIAFDAPFNSAHRQHDRFCLPGTRTTLLDEIYSWSTDIESQTIYWLSGMAGTGKSTIARTVAKTWQERGQLAASFMFSRGHDDLSHTRKFVTTIAFQLSYALQNPTIKERIANAIKDNPDIANRGLRDQWLHLVLQPLSGLESSFPKAFVLLIDALDECDSQDDIRVVIRLLESLKSVRLRVFITSRPEIPINYGFKEISKDSHYDFILHNIEGAIVQNDISSFLHYELEKIRTDRNLPTDWPGNTNIQTLTQMAGTLFIYASTVCRFIGERVLDPRKRLSLILDTKVANSENSATRSLDAMYTKILEQSVIGGCGDYYVAKQLLRAFRNIVGSIVILFDALPSCGAANLLGLDEWDVEDILARLGSVIDASTGYKIRLLHPSFRDFLLDRSRCIYRDFRIDRQATHHTMFLNCLKLISVHLRRDICALRRPGILRNEIDPDIIEKALPLHIQYACRHWISHLQQAAIFERTSNHLMLGSFSDDAVSAILKFFREDFLHWLEALSLINYISESCSAITTLEETLAMATGGRRADELISIIYDAKRFLLRYCGIAEKAPLQTYCASLIFCPLKSKLREYFWSEIPTWLKNRSTRPLYWESFLNVFNGHVNHVNSVAFSPDGKLLASASSDKTVKIWGPATGECQITMKGHSDSVSSAAFSPDGKLLASASRDGTVKIWDPATGECQITMKGHSDSVSSVAFSPDGKLFASASRDKTVKIWDPATGDCKITMKGHSSFVNSVAFSPDGKLLASASWDCTIKIWDLATGECQITMKSYFSPVKSVAFSPDSKLFASASWDKTVKIWHRATEECQITMKDHSSFVNSVAFSPDGKLIASASSDKTVKIWHRATGECQITMKGHSGSVNSAAFSPDGKLLASASDDKTIRTWHILIESSNSNPAAIFNPQQKKWAIKSLIDCKALAGWRQSITIQLKHTSYYFNPAILLPYAQNTSQLHNLDSTSNAVAVDNQITMKGHFDSVSSVAFSPDGKLFASASRDGTVKIWDPATGECQITIKGHSSPVSSVAFSPDGKLLASVSSGGAKIWDPATGEFQITMKGYPSPVNSAAFSPDGKLFASASWDGTFKIWDLATGKSQITMKGHSSPVSSVAFSPDGKLLASASWDGIVKIWDPATGECQITTKGHSDSVSSAAFSPDGKLLASASRDETVKIWDPATGECQRTFGLRHGNGRFVIGEDSVIECSRRSAPKIHFSSLAASKNTIQISVIDGWVQLRLGSELERLLLLASDDNMTCYDSWGSFLAFGYKSGQVEFFEFAIDKLPCFI